MLVLLFAAPAFAAGPLCPAREPRLPRPAPRAHAPGAHAARDGAPVHTPAPVAVGQQRTFWAWDFSVMPPGFRQVKSTCRAVGGRGLVFVEDSEWGTHVTDADLATVTSRFETSTPAGSLDSTHGIAQVVFDTFAPPPTSLDNDSHVILLFTAMASFNNTSFDGYFNAFDTLTEAEAETQHQHSNEAKILYLNTRGSGASSDYMLGVVAHELTHLVSHQFDDAEVSWLDESLGEAAMVACGYNTDLKHLASFCQKPETPLITTGYVSYGACFLFGTYLLEQLGPKAIGQIVRDPKHGAEGLEATLTAAGRAPFSAFYRDWALDNLMSHYGAASFKYHYNAFDVPALTTRGIDAVPGEDAAALKPYTIRYVRAPHARMFASMVLEPSGTGASVWVTDCCGGVRKVLSGNATVPLDDNTRFFVTVGEAETGYRLSLTPRP